MARSNSPIYALRQVTFQYKPSVKVLDVKRLAIYKGLTFVLGKSGIGKSTLIEALGSMNNTFTHQLTDKATANYLPTAEEKYDLSTLWQQPDQHISNFRKTHFSFIFQQTNLMPNLTAGENMIISKLIEGVSQEVAKKKVLQLMRSIGLEAALFDRKISNLSGGQRQRLTFIRAIAADFNVLFGDEPTGNLDSFTAEQLMKVLHKYLNNHQKTGVIVSHDIRLALKYADRIVLIAPRINDIQELEYGYIDERQVIRRHRNEWLDYRSNKIHRPINYIRRLINSVPQDVAVI